MEINVQDFKNSLNAVRPGVASRSVVEQMTHFVFTETEITAYDDQLCISIPFETGLKCTARATDVLRTVSKMQSEMVDIKMGDDSLICSYSTEEDEFEAEIPIQTRKEIYNYIKKVQNQRKEAKWVKIPKDFLKAIEFCMFAAGRDASKASLVCVAVKGKDVIAGDGVRFSWVELEETTRKNFMVNAESVAHLTKFGGFSHLAISDSWAHFKTKDKAIFHIRRTAGEYPIAKVKGLFGKLKGKTVDLAESRDTIKEAVDTAMVLSDEVLPDKIIEVTFLKGNIKCVGETVNGKITRKRKIKYKGGKFSFHINPVFFSQVLDRDEPGKLKYSEEGRIELASENSHHIIALKSVA